MQNNFQTPKTLYFKLLALKLSVCLTRSEHKVSEELRRFFTDFQYKTTKTCLTIDSTDYQTIH